ncbi:MAG TPA: hypothetical protein DEO83_03895 [Lachnospiraceae bacterium]|nr:DUF4176 domain-containing protein [Eubacterium sp.]HBZ02936.1 hypothetical protein [Lachnospiraceae bacterium]
MYKDLLPIGSVVRLADTERDVMICGRIVVPDGKNDIYDYVGCIYPEGISSGDDLVFFNRDAIELLLFVGFQDVQELTYRSEVLDELGELAVVNGEIVPVTEDETIDTSN